jgi:putative ABC transport system permease protein
MSRRLRKFKIAVAWACGGVMFHKVRSVLTVSGIGLATALLVGTLGFQSGYERALQRDIAAMGYQVLITGKGCPHEAATLILRGGSIPMYIQEEIYQRVAHDPEVSETTRFLMQTLADPRTGSHQLFVGIDENFLRLKPDVAFQRGGWFSDPLADEAILGFNVAEYRRLNVGDRIEVRGRSVVVRGILDKMGTQDDGTVFLPLQICQEYFDRRGLLTGVGVRLNDISRAADFIERVYELPTVQVVRMSQVQGTILGILNGVRMLLMAFGSLCLFIALLGVFNVSLITAYERVPELGVLRALGCPTPTLFRLVWCETLLLSVAGVLAGALLTFVLRGAVASFMRATLAFVPTGAAVETPPGTMLAASALVIVLSLLAGAYPAWKSCAVSPMTSIRGVR